MQQDEFTDKVTTILKNQTATDSQTQPLNLNLTLTLGLFGDTILCDNGEHTIELAPDGATGQFLLAALHSLDSKAKARIYHAREAAKTKKPKLNHTTQREAVKPLPSLVISKYIRDPSGNGKSLIPVKTLEQKQRKPERKILNLDLEL